MYMFFSQYEYNLYSIASLIVSANQLALCICITPKSTSKLRSAQHIRYSIVIPRLISRANTAQS